MLPIKLMTLSIRNNCKTKFIPLYLHKIVLLFRNKLRTMLREPSFKPSVSLWLEELDPNVK